MIHSAILVDVVLVDLLDGSALDHRLAIALAGPASVVSLQQLLESGRFFKLGILLDLFIRAIRAEGLHLMHGFVRLIPGGQVIMHLSRVVDVFLLALVHRSHEVGRAARSSEHVCRLI